MYYTPHKDIPTHPPHLVDEDVLLEVEHLLSC